MKANFKKEMEPAKAALDEERGKRQDAEKATQVANEKMLVVKTRA